MTEAVKELLEAASEVVAAETVTHTTAVAAINLASDAEHEATKAVAETTRLEALCQTLLEKTTQLELTLATLQAISVNQSKEIAALSLLTPTQSADLSDIQAEQVEAIAEAVTLETMEAILETDMEAPGNTERDAFQTGQAANELPEVETPAETAEVKAERKRFLAERRERGVLSL